MCLIAYFHRLTALILKTLADVVDAAEDDADGLEAEEISGHAPTPDTPPADGHPSLSLETETAPLNHSQGDEAQERAADIVIEAEDMTRMGLDVWSAADREFVVGLVELYWGRGCVVKQGGVDFCGVRLC